MRYLILLLLSTSAFSQNKELSFAWETNPRTFDPRFANDAFSQYLTELTNCSLIQFDRDGNVQNQLAQSIEWTGPKTLKIQIRTDVKFQDGTLVTIEDVLATYKFLSTPHSTHTSPLAGAFSKVKSVKLVSPNSMEFELHDSDATFVDNLFVGIQAKDRVEDRMIQDIKNLKSCGPFILSNIGINDYTLTKNTNYNLGVLAKVDTVRIKIVKDETTRFSKLRKGELDLVQNGISREQLKVLKSHPELTVQAREGLNVTYLGFNFRDPILSKKDVRKAISMSLNREQMIRYLMHGMAEPASTFLSSASKYRYHASNIMHDVKQAESLLDKAGFPRKDSAPRFELVIKTTSDVMRVNVARAVAGDLQKVGIKANVQILEWGKFKADVDKGEVQLWLLNWVGYKDPDIFRYVFATESFPPHGGNRGWYSNPVLDKLLNHARSIHEEKKRVPLYHEVQKIVEDDIPYAFLWHEKNFVVMQKTVKDFEVYADGRYSSLVRTYK